MTSAAKHDISVLNSLIETTLDSAEGYGTAAERVTDLSHKNLFRQWSAERRQVARDLQSHVRRLGGTPDAEGSRLAAGHRMFMKLRDRIAEGEENVIDEIERGEDFIKAKYEQALQNAALSAPVHDALARAYGSVKSGHDQARNLKHSFKARS